MKYVTLLLLIVNSSYALEFVVIPVTSNTPFNYFFSFPVYVTLIAIPLFMAISFLGRVK